MSMLRKISPFPEYNRIKENLYLRKRRSLEKECQNINVRIKKMRQSVDLEKEHG